jgi:signal transduction histidine kinase
LNSLRSILNESVTNAVRHGKANEILIRIKESTSASTKLEISIINNGISLEGAPKFGLGLNSISKVARSWNLKNLEDGRVGVLASL